VFRTPAAGAVLPGFMPLYGSSAIDAAANCKDLANATVSSDQNGTSRPQRGGCDLGAIEADYVFVGTFQ
jgi:hypothetical protein